MSKAKTLATRILFVGLLAATVLAVAPTAASASTIAVRPDMGPGGTEVRVLGGVSQACPSPSGASIVFVDAAQTQSFLTSVAFGEIHVVVYVPSGTSLGGGEFQVVQPVYFRPTRRCYPRVTAHATFTVTDGPGVFAFTPRRDPVGTAVTITGIRFTGTTKVKFDGISSVFTVDSDSQITATVPNGALTGPIKIVTPIGNAISGPNFKVT
jgi:hypothetical protein